MFKPNPVEFELPYDEGLLLRLHGEWIAERKLDGIRAVLEAGILKTLHQNLLPPGSLPSDWHSCVLDGCLVGSVYYLFDVLMLDGEDARRRPLYERRTLLRSLKLPDWCRLVPCGKNIGEFLEAVIRDGGKGIIVKNLLERYGQAQWVKVERPMVQEAVITGIDDAILSVKVGQFHQGVLVDRGTVFLGALAVQARVGQVIEVDMRGCTRRSGADQPRFVRFRADHITLDADASATASDSPGTFVQLRPQALEPHPTSPVGDTL